MGKRRTWSRQGICVVSQVLFTNGNRLLAEMPINTSGKIFEAETHMVRVLLTTSVILQPNLYVVKWSWSYRIQRKPWYFCCDILIIYATCYLYYKLKVEFNNFGLVFILKTSCTIRQLMCRNFSDHRYYPSNMITWVNSILCPKERDEIQMIFERSCIHTTTNDC